MANEDQRSAVNIAVALSGQLMSAALAILALGGGMLVFVLGSRQVGFWFYAFSILTFVAFVLSIWWGGRAIQKLVSDGFNGTWTLKAPGFNRQALACLFGLAFLLLAALLTGTPRADDTSSSIEKLRGDLRSIVQRFDALIATQQSFQPHLMSLVGHVDGIRVELSRLQRTVQLCCPPGRVPSPDSDSPQK